MSMFGINVEGTEHPDRQPDYSFVVWDFFFKEMIQWNSQDECSYKIKEESSRLFFYSKRYQKWLEYDPHVSEDIYKAYLDWQIDNLLLEGCSG